MRHKHTSGFSMVELMITIAIVAILLAVAFPSFEGSLRSNRVATATNELMASLALARSEAIRSPGGAAVCTSTDGETCNGTSWNDGWMVWIDADGDGAETGTNDRVVRYVQGHDRLAIEADSPGGTEAENLIPFDRRGRIVGDLRSVAVEPDECPSGVELRRLVSLNATGQARISREDCE